MKAHILISFFIVMWIIFSITNNNYARSFNNFNNSPKDSSVIIIDKIVPKYSDNSWLYENSASLIGSFITLIGFCLAFYQLRRNAKAAQGDLALKLDERMNQHRGIYKELFKGGIYYDKIPKDKIEDIEYYLTFYDTAALLVKNKQIYLDQINKLYGFRFTCLIHNMQVQDIIRNRSKSWQGIVWLYSRILKEREKNGEEIDRPKNVFKINK